MSEDSPYAPSDISTLTEPNSFPDADNDQPQSFASQSSSSAVNGSAVFASKPKKRSHNPNPSFIWLHSTLPIPGDKYPRNDKGQEVWRCSICPLHLAVLCEVIRTAGTAAALKHLSVMHGKKPEAAAEAKRLKRMEGNIQRAFEKQAEDAIRTHRRAQETVLKDTVDIGVLEKLLVRWISVDNLPSTTVQSEGFRTFIKYCNEEVESLLPKSHVTVTNWIKRTFIQE